MNKFCWIIQTFFVRRRKKYDGLANKHFVDSTQFFLSEHDYLVENFWLILTNIFLILPNRYFILLIKPKEFYLVNPTKRFCNINKILCKVNKTVKTKGLFHWIKRIWSYEQNF